MTQLEAGTANVLATGSPAVVAIIDDDQMERETWTNFLKDWGYTPVSMAGNYQNVDSLVDQLIARHPDFIFCDNHLKKGGYADFNGPQLAATLNSLKMPSLVVTQYQDDDTIELRKWRASIPVILDKDEIDEITLSQAFNKCSAEVVEGEVTDDRRSHRVLLKIDSIEKDRIIAFVDAWNPHKSVSFLSNQLNHYISDVSEGDYFFAEVNIGAAEWRDLFFKNFERAPEPSSDDGLA